MVSETTRVGKTAEPAGPLSLRERTRQAWDEAEADAARQAAAREREKLDRYRHIPASELEYRLGIDADTSRCVMRTPRCLGVVVNGGLVFALSIGSHREQLILVDTCRECDGRDAWAFVGAPESLMDLGRILALPAGTTTLGDPILCDACWEREQDRRRDAERAEWPSPTVTPTLADELVDTLARLVRKVMTEDPGDV